jgi:hypothetical protein
MTLPESFRPTGPLSGYLIFLTMCVHGVSRTIIHRGDWSYSASGLVHLPPPPSFLVPPILTLFLVLFYISPHSPAASRRVGVPLCFYVTLYIYNIYMGVSPPTPLSSQYKPFPYSIPSPFIVYCGIVAQ